MSQTYTVASAKGGVGKTTTTLNLGAALAELGHRVLLIDNDPERHLSNSLGIPASAKLSIATLMSAVLNDMELDDLLPKCIVAIGKLDCIPASPALAGMATQLAIKQNSTQMFSESVTVKSEFVLKQITDRLGDRYDYIIIDCGRSLDLLTINALVAAQKVIIPVQAHYLPEEGLGSFIETVGKIRVNLNPALEIAGILLTMYQGATNLCRSVKQDVNARFGGEYHVFSQPITHSIKVAEAPAFKKSIFEHDPTNPAAAGYLAMAKELLEYGKI